MYYEPSNPIGLSPADKKLIAIPKLVTATPLVLDNGKLYLGFQYKQSIDDILGTEIPQNYSN